MNRKNIIQEIMGNELEHIGFIYQEGDNRSWTYKRNNDGVIQYITVFIQRYTKNFLTMQFSTNAYGQKSLELEDIIPGVLQESWKYENEEEFREIIGMFKEWTFIYGLDVLEKISVPVTDERPKFQTNRYLYENHYELNEKYRRLWKYEGMNIVETAFSLQDKMSELKKKPFNEIEEMLVGFSAVFGHSINFYEKGIWTWDEEYQICQIINAGESGINLIPLNITIGIYKNKKGKQSDEDIIKQFMDVIHTRNTFMEAHNRIEDIIDDEEIYERLFKLREKIMGY